ncbi:hypothetical protein JE950_002420 [Flavobacterium psychrophilum]|nr:hypothetical protein [Flavobacterium psychrophilum]
MVFPILALSILFCLSFKGNTILKTAKVKDFILCHKEATILASSSYTTLNKLTDDQLKKACSSPADGNYVTVKVSTYNLRDGNTRIYLLKKRGFGDFSIPYDEVDTGSVCDF